MAISGRQFTAGNGYRYGFNGKEKDKDISDDAYDYGMRISDQKLGRFLSLDPIVSKYPELTPYQYASNSPLAGIDIDGLEFELNRANVEADIAKLKIEVAQQITFSGLFKNAWRGVKDKYKETINSVSKTSIKNTYNNAVGTAKDFGNMVIAKKGAAESFSNRVVNFSMGLSNSFSEPALFLGTMYNRSANENAYGIGYYGFQFGSMIATERVFSAINGSGFAQVANYEGNQIIRNVLKGGGRLIVVEADELRLMKVMGKEAGIRWMGNGAADIQIAQNATRAAVMEEAIHYGQYLKYGEDYLHTEIGRIQCEIEAQNELLRIGGNEKWSTEDMDRIKTAKSTWEKELKKIKK